MDATRSGHVAVALAETHNASIAASAQEQKVGSIWLLVVGCFDLFVPFDLVPSAFHLKPPVAIPVLEQVRVVVKCLPDFHQRLENVGPHPFFRRKSCEDGSAS